jgi:hypothetical protein
LNFPSSGDELVEAVLDAEEALPVVYAHIQLTVAAYSCNSTKKIIKRCTDIFGFNLIYHLVSNFTCSLLVHRIET